MLVFSACPQAEIIILTAYYVVSAWGHTETINRELAFSGLNNKREQHLIVNRNLQSNLFIDEIIFIVEKAPEGGYTARVLGTSIFTEADDLAGLRDQARDAVHCHFDKEQVPKIIRFHFVQDEVFVA